MESSSYSSSMASRLSTEMQCPCMSPRGQRWMDQETEPSNGSTTANPNPCQPSPNTKLTSMADTLLALEPLCKFYNENTKT